MHRSSTPLCNVVTAGYENWTDLQWPSSRIEERDPAAAEKRAQERAAIKARRTASDLNVKAISSHPDLSLPIVTVNDSPLDAEIGEPWPSSRWSDVPSELEQDWPSSRWEDSRRVSKAVSATHAPETVARKLVRSPANRSATMAYLSLKSAARREQEESIFSELHEAM